MRSSKAEFERRGVTIIAVSFAEPAKLIQYQQYHHWPFTILADPHRSAYRAFGLKKLSWFRVFSPASLRAYFTLLGKGKRTQDYGKDDYYQAGGDFLIDRAGNILLAHRTREPSDRPTVGMLLQEIDAIQEDSEKTLGKT